MTPSHHKPQDFTALWERRGQHNAFADIELYIKNPKKARSFGLKHRTARTGAYVDGISPVSAVSAFGPV
jgi:hypothetical protein